jgi:acetyltransferase EpsM
MYLYGASGHGRVIMEILESLNQKVDGFIDDNPSVDEQLGLPVLHSAESVDEVIVSIGDNGMRKRVVDRLHCNFAKSTVHPRAVVSQTVTIDAGSVVMAGAVINAGTVIGKHCVINTCASVDHECQIGDYVHIAPGAHLCGLIQVGEGTLIGAGASVIPCVKIGRWCTIGAGAAVVSDVPDGATVVGVPGRIVWRTSVPKR